MNLFNYIRDNGIKHTLSVVYKYKIDVLLKKVALAITKNKKLSDVIVIEGHNDFDSNGGAFYDYLVENGYNKKYKIVWLLKNKKPANLPKNVWGII